MTAPVSPKPAFRPSARNWLAAPLAGLAAITLLAACGTGPARAPSAPSSSAPADAIPDPAVIGVSVSGRPAAPGPDGVARPRVQTGAEFTPPYLRDADRLTRVAILLPFTGGSEAVRREAGHLLRAAELAVFERAGEDVILLPKDTGGTADGAADAVRAAIQDGAQLILGPLLAPAVDGAAREARAHNVPMIAFSTDASVAGDGVYLLSFPPSEEVRRVVEYAAERGASRFGFIGPASDYGRTVAESYRRAASEVGGSVTAEEFYSGGVSDMGQAARRLAGRGLERLDPRTASRMTGADWRPSDRSAFQAVILPEGGDELRMLAPSMLFADIDPLVVKFLGTGLWREARSAREPALDHGWFAGPDPRSRARFDTAYRDAYGQSPSNLAGLGYDAASLAVALTANTQGVIADRDIQNPSGFFGVDGLFRFRPDGTVERGMAVYRIRNGDFEIEDPAPSRFGPAGEPEEVESDDVAVGPT